MYFIQQSIIKTNLIIPLKNIKLLQISIFSFKALKN